MDLVGTAGYALDTPGALSRGVLAGRPGERASGRELLEAWGLLGENQPGLDAGDVAGFGVDMAVDPLNAIGAGWLTKASRGAKVAKEANVLSDALRASGGMPEEIAKLTKFADDATGMPKRLLHGTAAPEFGPREFLPDPGTGNWLGKGTYFTDDPKHLSEYQKMDKSGVLRPTQALSREEFQAAVRDLYKVLEKDLTESFPHHDLDTLMKAIPEGSVDEMTSAVRKYWDDMELLALSDDDWLVSRDTVAFRPVLAEQFSHFLGESVDDKIRHATPKNTRTMMAYVDSRKPFEMDAPMASETLERVLTDEQFARLQPDLSRRANSYERPFANYDLWAALQSSGGYSPDEITDVLRNAGYDAISHGPDTRNLEMFEDFVGSPSVQRIDPYSEFVPFDPSQIYSPWVAPARKRVPSVAAPATALAAHNAISPWGR